MKKIFLLLLLVIILINVAYWTLNKKFLHENIIAMVMGKSDTPALEFETEQQTSVAAPPSAEAVTVQAVNEEAVITGAEEEQIQQMIEKLRLEIEELQTQSAEIDESIDMLTNETIIADQKIQEIRKEYGMTPQQLERVLLENLAAQATNLDVSAEQPAPAQ